jgi:hypothetical protein
MRLSEDSGVNTGDAIIRWIWLCVSSESHAVDVIMM